MKCQTHRKCVNHRGFTLMEVSTAMGLMVMLSGALVVMLQQHLSFMGMARRQAFLAQEAPQIGNILGRIFHQADHFFIYSSHESALAGGAPVIENGGAVRLFFKTAVQTTEERLIAAETGRNGTSLRFYTPQPDGTETSWLICQGLQGATFNAGEGILTVTLTGPNGEEITYCGGSR
jgi:prepilin-type N-terminal cleavage/methylation domain-containing protein